MASDSLLNTFSQFLAPVQLAEAAVKEDDTNKLIPLLLNPKHSNDVNSKQLITEQVYVNQQAKETLLHFAVHQDAARCVALLSNPPYSWSADCPNLAGVSPTELAESRGYLPVWYPLASKSESTAPSLTQLEFDVNASRSVAAVLLYPHIFVKRPLTLSMLIASPRSLGDFVVLEANELTMRNLALLLELWLATPEIIQADESCNLHFWSPTAIPTSHPVDCQNYPICLAPHWNMNFHSGAQFQSIFDAWVFHRLHPNTGLPASRSVACALVPLTLLDFCRLNMRRILVTKLIHSSPVDAKPKRATNYARLVSRLPIPSYLQAFLAYRDLWPAWKRHMVRAHRIGWIPLPEQHLLLDDPWFPDIIPHLND